MTAESRKPTWVQSIIQSVVPGLILLVLSWMALEFIKNREHNVQIIAKIDAVEVKVDNISRELNEHNEYTTATIARNLNIHHRKGIFPCEVCH